MAKRHSRKEMVEGVAIIGYDRTQSEGGNHGEKAFEKRDGRGCCYYWI